jgi:hypothetical protein
MHMAATTNAAVRPADRSSTLSEQAGKFSFQPINSRGPARSAVVCRVDGLTCHHWNSSNTCLAVANHISDIHQHLHSNHQHTILIQYLHWTKVH